MPEMDNLQACSLLDLLFLTNNSPQDRDASGQVIKVKFLKISLGLFKPAFLFCV